MEKATCAFVLKPRFYCGIKILEHPLGANELFELRDRSRCFYRKLKAWWACVAPLLQVLDSGKAIECDVKFQGVEMFTIVAEPVFLCEFIGVERASPMFIVESRTANMRNNHGHFTEKQEALG